MKINKFLRWIIFLSCIMFIFSGCTNTETNHTVTIGGTPVKQEIIAVYDTPEILVPYDEIINTYHLRQKENQFSTQEIEEIFNLVQYLRNDPKIKELNVEIHLNDMFLSRDNQYIIVSTKTYDYGPTAAAGCIIYLYHTSGGKYELVRISPWIS